MPGTPDLATATLCPAPLPGPGRDSSDSDSSDTELQEAASRHCHRVRMLGDGGQGTAQPHFPSWIWEGNGLGRAWGGGEDREEVLGAAGGVRMGAGQPRATFS